MKPVLNNQIIAVFDFDNTLSSCGTTIPFFRYLYPKQFYLKFLTVFPQALLFELNLFGIDRLNAAFVHRFFQAKRKKDLLTIGSEFNRKIMPALIKAEAMARLHWHQAQGHYCMLATSAYDIYISDWGRQHGFDAVVSSELEFNEQGLATGKLAGPSCYGPEKLQRIIEVTAGAPIAYAYGDSNGDREMLAAAKYPFYRRFS